MSRASRVCWLGLSAVVLAALAVGCDDARQEPAPDAAAGLPPDLAGEPLEPREPPGERDIRILSGSRMQLGFGEQAQLRVRLRDGKGEPAVGERVSFGLRGRSQDASLDALDAITDDEGEAMVTLTAGEMAATFDLRVSAAGAIDRHVGVAISDSGFGSLQVDAPYDGRRDVRERVVVVQSDTSCEELVRSAGDPSFTLLGEQALAEFLALPAEERYAVAGFAQGPSGVVLAEGCVDGVEIRAARTTEVTLEFGDAALLPASQLALELTLDAYAPASWLGSVLSNAAEAAVRYDAEGEALGTEAEALFLLDALDATLRDPVYDQDDLADAVVQARTDAGGLLEKSLRSLLAVNDQGPLRAIEELEARTMEGLEQIGLQASVRIENVGADFMLGAWTLLLSSSAEQGESVASVMLPSTLPTALGFATRVEGADALHAEAVSLRVTLGALAARLLRAAAALEVDGDAQAPIALVGCATLEEWLQKREISGSDACDEDCFASVCERAMSRLLGAAEPALVAVDEGRPELRLAGTLVLDDRDGDLIADVIEADELDGVWLPAEGGGSGAAVSGSGQATPSAIAE